MCGPLSSFILITKERDGNKRCQWERWDKNRPRSDRQDPTIFGNSICVRIERGNIKLAACSFSHCRREFFQSVLMKPILNILHIEDSKEDCDLIRKLLLD